MTFPLNLLHFPCLKIINFSLTGIIYCEYSCFFLSLHLNIGKECGGSILSSGIGFGSHIRNIVEKGAFIGSF